MTQAASDAPNTLHTLHLDQRQRAMLAAMGTPVWWPETIAAAVTSTAKPASPAKVAASLVVPVPMPNLEPPTRQTTAHGVGTMDWAELTQSIQSCQACGLCLGRQNAVPGMGPQRARWMVVGEALTELEDKHCLPFAGPAGPLLDAMLAAMGLTRADVFATNVAKCRPPPGRNPTSVELAQCRPYLMRQIELVQPDLILALGRQAAHSLLAGVVPHVDTLPLGKLRGVVHRLGGRPVVVSYDVAALLRNSAEKGKAWADLCLAMEALGYNPWVPTPTKGL